jgi:hypothetical protein
MAKTKRTATSKATTAPSQIKTVLDALAEQYAAAVRETPGYDSNFNWFSLVATFGQEFTPAPKPKGIRWGKAEECFWNAYRLMIAHDGLIYCEGAAISSTSPVSDYPVHHAWVVDVQGNVTDNTWREPGIGYYGIPFRATYVVEQLEDREMSGILEDNELLFEKGIPKTALAKV